MGCAGITGRGDIRELDELDAGCTALRRRCSASSAGSIGSVGDALDNALMESTIGLFKAELVERHPRSWTGRAELERETASWVHWYNTARLHSAIGYVPPVEYERHYRDALPAASIPEVA